jgi:hypothetical protein
VCWQECPQDYVNDGAFCRRPKPLKIIAKDSYGRGVGSPMGCPPDQEKDGALCYNNCQGGYNGIGPVCWQTCPPERPFNCGAGCAVDQGACATGVLAQVTSVIELAGNIVALAATAGGSTGFTMARVPAQSAAQLATTSQKVKKAILDVAKDLAQDAAENIGMEIIDAAYNGKSIDWSAMDPTGIAAVVKAFSRPHC